LQEESDKEHITRKKNNSGNMWCSFRERSWSLWNSKGDQIRGRSKTRWGSRWKLKKNPSDSSLHD